MVLSKDLKTSICFGLIIGVLISISNLCFANTETEITFTEVFGVTTNYSTMEFTSSSGSVSLKVFSVVPGATYRIYNTAGSARHFAYSSDMPAVGVSILDYFDIDAGGSSGRSDYITVPDDVNYLFLTTAFNNQNTWIYKVDGGLNGFVDSLTNSLSFENLGQVVALSVPILAISVLFGLGFYLLKRILNKTKKAKGGV